MAQEGARVTAKGNGTRWRNERPGVSRLWVQEVNWAWLSKRAPGESDRTKSSKGREQYDEKHKGGNVHVLLKC